MKTEKPILDVTCGGRMMWFDKHNPACLYLDNRELSETQLCDGRRFNVKPDLIADFTNLPFEDNTFGLVVFDPPHLIRAGDDAYMAIKYGRLDSGWKETLRAGFSECIRVLKQGGTLIFKWNEYQVPTKDVIKAIGQEPLFGHISGRASKTHWMTFMKFPGKCEIGGPHGTKR